MAGAAALAIGVASAALAQSTVQFSSSPFRFTQQDGEAIYRSICAGCHMPDGRGAVGAGAYPSLIRNAKLEAGGYPVLLVVNGRKAMPAFGSVMNDAQIAAVVNFVRSNFGDAYADPVSVDDVKAVCSLASEGVVGAIAGRALYEGKLDFKQAQAAADKTPAKA